MSKTVSLEMAKRLAAAGLTPEYKRWQVVYLPDGRPAIILSCDANYLFVSTWHGNANIKSKSAVWAPTTDDLLDWLEGEGYEYTLGSIGSNRHAIFIETKTGESARWTADTRPDAVGEGVCWALGQKGGE